MRSRAIWLRNSSTLANFISGRRKRNHSILMWSPSPSAQLPSTCASSRGSVVFSTVGLRLNYRVPKQDFDGAVKYLEGEAARGAVIAAAAPACFPVERYYLKTDWPCLQSVDDLQSVLAAPQPVLVLYTLSDHIEAGLRGRLRGNCAESRRFPGTLGDGDVVVCDPRRKAGVP